MRGLRLIATVVAAGLVAWLLMSAVVASGGDGILVAVVGAVGAWAVFGAVERHEVAHRMRRPRHADRPHRSGFR